MIEKEINLCGVPFVFTDIDAQCIFKDNSGFSGYDSNFTIEWRGLGWYLVDSENTFEKIYLPHIVAAYKWLEDNYDIKYHRGVGTIRYKEKTH